MLELLAALDRLLAIASVERLTYLRRRSLGRALVEVHTVLMSVQSGAFDILRHAAKHKGVPAALIAIQAARLAEAHRLLGASPLNELLPITLKGWAAVPFSVHAKGKHLRTALSLFLRSGQGQAPVASRTSFWLTSLLLYPFAVGYLRIRSISPRLRRRSLKGSHWLWAGLDGRVVTLDLAMDLATACDSPVDLYATEPQHAEAVQVVASIAHATERLRKFISAEFRLDELSS